MTIEPRDYHRDLTPAERAEVDQIVASHLQPTGPDWDMPSGSGGHMPWLDDIFNTRRRNFGFPSDPVQWAEESGLPPSAVPYLERVLDGTAIGGHELILPSERIPSFLQSPPRHWPRFEDHCEDELLYQGACERYDAETVVKRMSFVVIPDDTPARAAERIARKYIPSHYFGQNCNFSGPHAPKSNCDRDRDRRPKKSVHAPSHPSHKLVLFRRGATFMAVPVCDECLWGEVDERGGRVGGGLVDDLAGHGEAAVIVDYRADADPEAQRLRADDQTCG